MSEYHTWGIYAKYSGQITHEMLNKSYGDAGMFFETLTQAEKHQKKAGGQIYPIRNYYSKDLEYKNPRPGAKPYIEGYYVSHPPELTPSPKVYQFTGRKL